jgi:CheY-like chemotaxis protein
MLKASMENAIRASGPSVLIVDDDALCRRAVAMRMARLNAKVVEAEDGFEAFELLRRQPFDLAIVDLEMPKMDGCQLISCIRGFSGLKKMPVVVLTSRCDRDSIEQALVAGATSFLIKPLNWTAFGEHIEHLLLLVGSTPQSGNSNFDKATAANEIVRAG